MLMSPRMGLTATAVVAAALAVVDEVGADGLTLARVAERTGVATPSLYKHVDGLPALRALVSQRVLAELAEELRTAAVGRAGADAVRALLAAYRGYVHEHPHRFAFLEPAPDPDDPRAQAASNRVVEPVFAVLRGYGMRDHEVVHAARCLRAAVHGFAGLEAAGGFGLPTDVDASFEYLLDILVRGLAAQPAAPAEPTPERRDP
jgi:AcrR family transcriptional regulator